MIKTLLLVACVLIDIAILVYFFYWNRLVAWILGTIIRLVYWNEGASSLWLEIGTFLRCTHQRLMKLIEDQRDNTILYSQWTDTFEGCTLPH
jgi:hypothetical protein